MISPNIFFNELVRQHPKGNYINNGIIVFSDGGYQVACFKSIDKRRYALVFFNFGKFEILETTI